MGLKFLCKIKVEISTALLPPTHPTKPNLKITNSVYIQSEFVNIALVRSISNRQSASPFSFPSKINPHKKFLKVEEIERDVPEIQ